MITTASTKRTAHAKRKIRKPISPSIPATTRNTLGCLTDDALNSYFATLNGHKPGDLYQLVIGEVEKPLLKAVLGYTNGNQSEAAEILGINRGTLRKKLKTYKLLGR